jgi:hypothetical protein
MHIMNALLEHETDWPSDSVEKACNQTQLHTLGVIRISIK